jgi:hypothetical protein
LRPLDAVSQVRNNIVNVPETMRFQRDDEPLDVQLMLTSTFADTACLCKAKSFIKMATVDISKVCKVQDEYKLYINFINAQCSGQNGYPVQMKQLCKYKYLKLPFVSTIYLKRTFTHESDFYSRRSSIFKLQNMACHGSCRLRCFRNIIPYFRGKKESLV